MLFRSGEAHVFLTNASPEDMGFTGPRRCQTAAVGSPRSLRQGDGALTLEDYLAQADSRAALGTVPVCANAQPGNLPVPGDNRRAVT